MFITWIHIAIIVLLLAPGVLCAWCGHSSKCVLLDILISGLAVFVGFLLIVPVSIEKFGFNHVIELLIWLATVSLLSITVFVLCMVNLKRKSNGIGISVFSLIGSVLVLTAVFEDYCWLLIASLVFTCLGVIRFTVFNKARNGQGKRAVYYHDSH